MSQIIVVYGFKRIYLCVYLLKIEFRCNENYIIIMTFDIVL